MNHIYNFFFSAPNDTTSFPTFADESQLLSDTVPAPQTSPQGLPVDMALENGTLSSQASEAQPVTREPVAHTSGGISSVAQFLPSQAKHDHATLSPSQALASGEVNVDGDATMTDATAAQSEAQAPQSHEPLTNGDSTTTHVDAPAPADKSAVAESKMAASEPVAPAVADAPAIVDTSAVVDAPAVLDAPMEDVPAPALPPPQDIPAPSVETSSVVPESSVPQADTSSIAPGPSAPKVEPTVDQKMQDAPLAGIVRQREEDESTGEPSAKRTKVEEPISEPVQTIEEPAPEPAEFKRPDLPAAAPAPPVTNGTNHLPGKRAFSTSPLTPGQKKLLEDKMKNTKKVKSALPFLIPVDYIALNIPNYPDVIKTPMDLGTMEKKLKEDQYSTLDDFVGDFELMVNNCFTFNGPAHAISASAQNLRAYFLKQMESVPTGEAAATLPKPVKKASPAASKPPSRRESRANVGAARSPATSGETFALLPGGTPQIRRDSNAGRPKRAVVPPPSKDLPYSNVKPKRKENQVGLKFCEYVLEELRKPKHDKYAFAFREPVDPVALNIPTYFSVIKHAMDMGTITNKLKNGQYSTAEEFKGDFDLMFSNCFKFNPPDNAVHGWGKELQREFEALWSKKSAWVKKNQPQSQRASPASDDESDGDDSEDDDENDGLDSNEMTIAKLKEQLASMQNMVAAISGAKRASPKAGGKKKSRTSGGGSKSKKSAASAPAPRAAAKASKPKKQRLVTYEEKQEISNATENMSEAQVGKLTQIITENVDKYKV